jgi:hypothetical protein
MRWVVIAILVGTVGSSAAQPADIVATGPLFVGCRALVKNDPNGDPMQMGACAGAVRATVDISRTLPRACPPANDVVEVARVVIMFVGERPERKSQEFGPFALTAIGYKWPCSVRAD